MTSSATKLMSKKETAVAFLQLAASGRAREAFATHAGDRFVHHNPYFEGTAEALLTAMDENARQNPEKRLDVLRSLEDGDLVAVHSHVRQKRGDVGAVVVHIFRFTGDRIVELWDLGQEIPAESVNANGML
jgi:predicted SnoaL-like aldol condensation-catalyzing enzyme